MPEIIAPQGELNRGFEKAEFVAGVVACAFEHVGIDRLLFKKEADAVCKLDFTTSAFSSLFKESKNLRGQNIAANNCQIGWSFICGWFFDNVEKPQIGRANV